MSEGSPRVKGYSQSKKDVLINEINLKWHELIVIDKPIHNYSIYRMSRHCNWFNELNIVTGESRHQRNGSPLQKTWNMNAHIFKARLCPIACGQVESILAFVH
jgi:hypothetical protein